MPSNQKPVDTKKKQRSQKAPSKKLSPAKPATPNQPTINKSTKTKKAKRIKTTIDRTLQENPAIHDTWSPNGCPEIVFRCEIVDGITYLLASFAGSRVFKSSLLANQATKFSLQEAYSNHRILSCSVARDDESNNELGPMFKLIKLKHPNGLIENQRFLVLPTQG